MRLELDDLEVQNKCVRFTSLRKWKDGEGVAILVSETTKKLDYMCFQGDIFM